MARRRRRRSPTTASIRSTTRFAEDRRHAGAHERDPMVQSPPTVEQASARLVGVFRLRQPRQGVSGCRLPRRRSRARFPLSAAQDTKSGRKSFSRSAIYGELEILSLWKHHPRPHDMETDRGSLAPMAALAQNLPPVVRAPLCRQTPEVGAVCGNPARTVLCGGAQQ